MRDICRLIVDNWKILLIILIITNSVSFALFGIDKAKSKIKNCRRIPEKTLRLSAFFMGGLGAFLGMQIFRHKTKHLSFTIPIPVFLALQTILLVLIFILGT